MTETEVRTRRALPAEIGAMLRAARHRAGLSSRRAAARAGISRGHLLDSESGRRCPSVVVADALADALELTDAERADLAAAAVPDAGFSRPGRVATLHRNSPRTAAKV